MWQRLFPSSRTRTSDRREFEMTPGEVDLTRNANRYLSLFDSVDGMRYVYCVASVVNAVNE
jgi:hypothetical protein